MSKEPIKSVRKRSATVFQPGNNASKGHGGRKPVPPDLKEMYKMGNLAGTKMALEMLNNPETSPAVRVDIWEKFMSRDLGKPAQSVTVDGGGQINLICPVNLDGV
jgi:hypothetical protein